MSPEELAEEREALSSPPPASDGMDALTLTREIFSVYVSWCYIDAQKKAAALITKHDRDVREGCAERAIEWSRLSYPESLDITDEVAIVTHVEKELRAAILQEES